MNPSHHWVRQSTQASAAGTRRVAVVRPGKLGYVLDTADDPALIVRPPPRTQPEASQRLNWPVPAARAAQGFTSIIAKTSWYYVVEGTFLFDAGDERHD